MRIPHKTSDIGRKCNGQLQDLSNSSNYLVCSVCKKLIKKPKKDLPDNEFLGRRA